MHDGDCASGAGLRLLFYRRYADFVIDHAQEMQDSGPREA
ncbi:hypothetical protein L1274_005548 [Duganella sp. HSC-15S17]|uniref:Uncharacterized protein n=1 Tax=Duganella violaceipulchra TaxID=2849652 RepID=A0ABT1GS24_9BURK|nr:hypothetical protein [Duganella violaceicalia]